MEKEKGWYKPNILISSVVLIDMYAENFKLNNDVAKDALKIQILKKHLPILGTYNLVLLIYMISSIFYIIHMWNIDSQFQKIVSAIVPIIGGIAFVFFNKKYSKILEEARKYQEIANDMDFDPKKEKANFEQLISNINQYVDDNISNIEFKLSDMKIQKYCPEFKKLREFQESNKIKFSKTDIVENGEKLYEIYFI